MSARNVIAREANAIRNIGWERFLEEYHLLEQDGEVPITSDKLPKELCNALPHKICFQLYVTLPASESYKYCRRPI